MCVLKNVGTQTGTYMQYFDAIRPKNHPVSKHIFAKRAIGTYILVR